jgi:Bardet-Biedl syndrome 7 protein
LIAISFIALNEANIEHLVRLVYPKLKYYQEITRNYKILQALMELNVQNDEEFEMLSDEFKTLLQNKQDLEEKFNVEAPNLNQLNRILVDIYVDKHKFKGINVKGKLESFTDVLNSEDLTETDLIEAFDSNYER